MPVSVKGTQGSDCWYSASFYSSTGAGKNRAYKESRCVVLLSIENNKYCKEAFLSGILQGSVKTFSHVMFLIVDLPHWHNLKTDIKCDNLELFEEKLKEKAALKAATWFEKNQDSFLQLLPRRLRSDMESYAKQENDFQKKISFFNSLAKDNNFNFEILTWGPWINKVQNIPTLPVSDSIEKAVLSAAQKYVGRRVEPESNDYSRKLSASKDYIKEEGLGLYSVGIKLRCEFVAYPGDMMEVFRLIKNQLVSEITTKPLMEWLTINFKGHQSSKLLAINSLNAFFQNLQTEAPSFDGQITLSEITDDPQFKLFMAYLVTVQLNSISNSNELFSMAKATAFLSTALRMNEKTPDPSLNPAENPVNSALYNARNADRDTYFSLNS